MKFKTLKGAALVAATSMLPLSQAAMAEVTISGWVNEAVTFYDDGESSDAVVHTDGGNTLGTRLIFSGEQEVSTGITAGFELSMESRSDALGWGTTPGADVNDDQQGNTINWLNSNLHIGGAWGKVTVGAQSMPTDNIAVLEDPSLTLWSSISPVFRGTAVAIRDGSATPAVAAGGVTAAGGAPTVLGGATWGNFLNCFAEPILRGGLGIGIDCNGAVRNGIRYDLPAFGPVTIAIGYANDDVYDVAAKYKGDLGSMKAQLAIGYAINQGIDGLHYNEAENFQMQAGLMHPATGLFGSIAYQHEESDLIAGLTTATNLAGGKISDESDAWWLKVGIKKQWFSMGETSIDFNYGQYDDEYGLAQALAGVNGSEVERIGVGVNQYFGSSLIIYGNWQSLDLGVDGLAATAQAAYGGAEDLDTFTLGAVYFF